MKATQRRKKSASDRQSRKARFSVRDYPFYYMHAIITKNNRNIGEALKPMKLTPAIWRILALLQERDGITIGELAEESLIERTLLSRVLQQLERRGLLRRRLDNSDKRRAVIKIEPKGLALFEQIHPIGRRQIERGVHGLSSKELGRLKTMLVRILDNVDREEVVKR
jgi:DNA-binding MarR family transcriptional regulator